MMNARLLLYHQIVFILVMQQKILFSAKLSSNVSANVKNGVLQYNTVITNVRGAYNRKDCVFTTPVEGYYAFSWATSQFDRKLTYSALMKNGAVILYQSAYALSVENASDSPSHTLSDHLMSGDRVWVAKTDGSNPYVDSSGNGCVFTGIKL